MLGLGKNTTETVQFVPSGTAKIAIEVRDLHKSYPDKKAVDGVSFAVLRGEIFGILGPNGAGKTTTLEMIEGLREADQGTLSVDGLNVRNPRERDELHQRIGLQLQTSSLFDELTVKENLEMLAMLYRASRKITHLLKEFNLEEKANSRLEGLSGGQKQRLALAAALINDPALVFLDEPTNALDPQARRNVWDSIRRLQQAGKTVVMTTHYMEEAELLCERVAIMDDGKIVALDTPAALIARYASEQSIGCRFEKEDLGEAILSKVPGVTKVQRNGNGDNSAYSYRLYTRDLATSLAALVQLAEQRGSGLVELTTHAPTLEDVFINLTGRHLRD